MFTNESNPSFGWSEVTGSTGSSANGWWSSKSQGNGSALGESSWNGAAAFTPAMTVWENSNFYFVSCELPGVCEKDAEVIWHNGMLVVRGQKFTRAPESSARTWASDQWNGHFYRAINMQQVAGFVDAGQISTRWTNGVLEVTLPKARQWTENSFKIGSTR